MTRRELSTDKSGNNWSDMWVGRVNCKIHAMTRRKLLAEKSDSNWSDMRVDRTDVKISNNSQITCLQTN